LFNEAFPDRVELKEVKRQHESEIRLKKALDDVRAGGCDEDIETYFIGLNREPCCDSNDLVHIYFRKLPVEIYNIDVLSSLPGDFLILESTVLILDAPSTLTIR
jgi:hypothetical protein